MTKAARVLGLSTTTSKGQTTIPKQVRDIMGIKDGTALTWTYDNGELIVRAKTKRLEDFVPLVPPNGRRVSIDEMSEAVGEAMAEHVTQSRDR